MPLVSQPEPSVTMKAADKNTGVTIVEMEELLIEARRRGAPDNARVGADLKLSFDSPGVISKATVLWSVD